MTPSVYDLIAKGVSFASPNANEELPTAKISHPRASFDTYSF